MGEVSIRVGKYEGDLAKLVQKVSPAFQRNPTGREDIPKYMACVHLPGEKYYIVFSDRSLVSKRDYNLIVTVTGPRYEQAEQIMSELEEKLGVPFWEAPENIIHDVRVLTHLQDAVKPTDN